MTRRQTSSSAAALPLSSNLSLPMFNAIWKMKEGFVSGAGLIVVGLLLQFTVGPINWSDFAFPINIIFLVLYLLSLSSSFMIYGTEYGSLHSFSQLRPLSPHWSMLPCSLWLWDSLVR